MKGARLINRFSEKKKKKSLMGKWAILGPEMVHPHNSGSTVRIYLKFCTIKGANRQMKMILIFVWGKWTILDPKMVHSCNSGSAVTSFFKFCRIKRASR